MLSLPLTVKPDQSYPNRMYLFSLCLRGRSFGTVPMDHSARRQLRQDLQLATEEDYSIVLTRAEKLHSGIYTFLKGDPRESVARVQANLEWL